MRHRLSAERIDGAGQLTSPADDKPLEGVRVLIVEDEFLLAVLLQEDLHELGCTTAGPFTNIESALDGAPHENFDIAILDINLNGKPVFPLADALIARGHPVILLTGYSVLDLPERFRACPRVAKPYDLAVLTRELVRLSPKKS
jgi:DNA-binding response OmpR family regulator